MTKEQVIYVLNNLWSMEDLGEGIFTYLDNGEVNPEFIQYCKDKNYI